MIQHHDSLGLRSDAENTTMSDPVVVLMHQLMKLKKTVRGLREKDKEHEKQIRSLEQQLCKLKVNTTVVVRGANVWDDFNEDFWSTSPIKLLEDGSLSGTAEWTLPQFTVKGILRKLNAKRRKVLQDGFEYYYLVFRHDDSAEIPKEWTDYVSFRFAQKVQYFMALDKEQRFLAVTSDKNYKCFRCFNYFEVQCPNKGTFSSSSTLLAYRLRTLLSYSFELAKFTWTRTLVNQDVPNGITVGPRKTGLEQLISYQTPFMRKVISKAIIEAQMHNRNLYSEAVACDVLATTLKSMKDTDRYKTVLQTRRICEENKDKFRANSRLSKLSSRIVRPFGGKNKDCSTDGEEGKENREEKEGEEREEKGEEREEKGEEREEKGEEREEKGEEEKGDGRDQGENNVGQQNEENDGGDQQPEETTKEKEEQGDRGRGSQVAEGKPRKNKSGRPIRLRIAKRDLHNSFHIDLSKCMANVAAELPVHNRRKRKHKTDAEEDRQEEVLLKTSSHARRLKMVRKQMVPEEVESRQTAEQRKNEKVEQREQLNNLGNVATTPEAGKEKKGPSFNSRSGDKEIGAESPVDVVGLGPAKGGQEKESPLFTPSSGDDSDAFNKALKKKKRNEKKMRNGQPQQSSGSEASN